jgi:hypothetical protein
MATTTKKLFRGTATTTNSTTLYTVPSATTTVITNIAITNTASASRTIVLAIAGTNLMNGVTVAANTTVYIDLKQVINATETIQGGASVADVNFHISGVEIA